MSFDIQTNFKWMKISCGMSILFTLNKICFLKNYYRICTPYMQKICIVFFVIYIKQVNKLSVFFSHNIKKNQPSPHNSIISSQLFSYKSKCDFSVSMSLAVEIGEKIVATFAHYKTIRNSFCFDKVLYATGKYWIRD